MRGLSVVLLAVLLSGCQGMMAFSEGKALFAEGQNEAGFAKLEEAVRLEPKNVEYRIALTNMRSVMLNQQIMLAEKARREGLLSDAEKAYRQALAIDPGHVLAQQGLDAVTTERRHRQVVSDAEGVLKQGGPGAYQDALEKLRPVLSENPGQKEALNLKARIDEEQSKEQKVDSKLAESFRKTISLELRDAPLKGVFDLISKVSGLNFFFDKDIRPDLKTSVLAKNTTVEDAMRMLLVTNQLDQKVLGDNTILVYPNTPQKQQDYQSLSVRAFLLTNSDAKAVSNTIKTIVKTKDMVVDERLGLIIVRDTPDAIRLAERIVALQDLSDPEVVLELEVLEIKRTRLLELGIQWPTQLTLAPLQSSGVPLTVADLRALKSDTTQVTIGNTFINARRESQNSNILANPRIRVRNKEKAKIMIGERVPVITTTSTSTGFVSESISYVDVGLKLEVEPNIFLDEEVAIKVNLEVSSLVREVLSKTGSLSYQIGTRGASTVLRLKNGETQVLAGLISDEERSTGTKLPGLGEIPLIGRLFGSQKDDGTRSEIVLAVTPRVVRSLRRPDLMMAEFDSGTSNNIGGAALRLSTAESAKGPVEKGPALASTARGNGPSAIAMPSGQSGSVSAAPVVPSAAETRPVVSGKSVGTATTIAPGPASVPATVTSSGVNLSWQAPSQVKAGEQFSAVLRISSQTALRGLPLLLGYDPQVLQVINVQEGDFFKQGNAQTSFSHRIDAVQGRVFVAAVRQSSGGSDNGTNGTGGLIMVSLKALKSGDARMQLLSASPEPALPAPMPLPIEHQVKVAP